MKTNNCIYYHEVSTLSEDGFALDISLTIINLRKEWNNVGIHKFDSEADIVTFICWGLK